MPTASCAGVQLSVGLPATAGGAVTTALTSGGLLSTVTWVAAEFSTFPALSVTTTRRKRGPSGGWLFPDAVFQVTVVLLAGLLAGMLPLPQPLIPFAE